MKIRCDRKAFLDAVSLVSGVTASRSTRPVLQHILISAHDDQVELSATDLELSIRCVHRQAIVEESGTIALPAARLQGILREAGGESVDINTDGLVAMLRSSGSQFRLSGEHPEDFPELPSADEVEFLEIPAAMFKELADRTEFAASRELGRYAINGVLVEIEGASVRFVATDGRRLAMAEATLEKKVKGGGREILPLKGVTQFLKSVGPEIETVGLSLGGRRTMLRAGDTVLSATSVEAEFPDYQAVIGVQGDKTVTLERDAFFSCVRQAAVMAGDDARAVNLEFSEGSLVLSSAVEGLGDARSEMAVDYVGENVKVAFNPDFLLDFAKVKLPEQLPLQFKDSSAAAVIRPAENYLYVVMPINA